MKEKFQFNLRKKRPNYSRFVLLPLYILSIGGSLCLGVFLFLLLSPLSFWRYVVLFASIMVSFLVLIHLLGMYHSTLLINEDGVTYYNFLKKKREMKGNLKDFVFVSAHAYGMMIIDKERNQQIHIWTLRPSRYFQKQFHQAGFHFYQENNQKESPKE